MRTLIYMDRSCKQDPRLSDMLAGWWPPATKKKDDGKVPPAYDPCVGVEVADYLNRPEVQRALHANTTALPYPWTECSNVVDYSDEDLMTSMLPVYRWLFKNAPALRLMIYSGDVDGIVPVLGTRTWIRELGMHMEEDLKVGGVRVHARIAILPWPHVMSSALSIHL